MSNEMMSLEEMMAFADAEAEKPFEQKADYHHGSDSLFIKLKPGPYLRERVDGRLTIEKDLDSGEIIGAQIKGFKAMHELITKKPGYRVWVAHNSKINVGYLLQSYVMENCATTAVAVHYVKLSKTASAIEVDPELCGAC